jgi:aldehyde dehydrogenase (NAD+)
LRQIINDSINKDVFGIVSSKASFDFLAKCIVVDQARTFAASGIPKRILSSPVCRNIAVVDRTGNVKLAAREIVASHLAFWEFQSIRRYPGAGE